MNTKKLGVLSMVLALSLILAYVDILIPYNFVIPGIKLGLANIAILFTLYKFGSKEAICVSILRVLIIGVLFNNGITFLYSICGCLLSLLVMIVSKKLVLFDECGVCIVGALAHNLGQLLCAMFILDTNLLWHYLPYLLLSGLLSGFIVGIISLIIIKRVNV